jgi:hypothetical protein
MCREWYKLMDKAVYKNEPLVLTTNPQQVYGSDANRLTVILSGGSTFIMYLSFSMQTPNRPQFMMQQSATPLILRQADIGNLITQPIWLWVASGGPTLSPLTVVSALPQSLLEYEHGRPIPNSFS